MNTKSELRQWLDERRVPYVDVTDARRQLFAEVPCAALELIVYCADGPNLLIALGSRLDSAAIESMRRWGEVFGPDFRAVRVWREAGTWFAGAFDDPQDGEELGSILFGHPSAYQAQADGFAEVQPLQAGRLF